MGLTLFLQDINGFTCHSQHISLVVGQLHCLLNIGKILFRLMMTVEEALNDQELQNRIPTHQKNATKQVLIPRIVTEKITFVSRIQWKIVLYGLER